MSHTLYGRRVPCAGTLLTLWHVNVRMHCSVKQSHSNQANPTTSQQYTVSTLSQNSDQFSLGISKPVKYPYCRPACNCMCLIAYQGALCKWTFLTSRSCARWPVVSLSHLQSCYKFYWTGRFPFLYSAPAIYIWGSNRPVLGWWWWWWLNVAS